MPTSHLSRRRLANDRPLRADGDYVVYWMIAARRMGWNYGLQRAIDHAVSLKKPLFILEALRCDYRWASDRLHRFVIEGMAANAVEAEDSRALYYPYVEPQRGADQGLLAALAKRACVVVADDFPAFFLPRMLDRVGLTLPVQLEVVDSNGLAPIRLFNRSFARAVDFRRALQKSIRPHLEAETFPLARPLKNRSLPAWDDAGRKAVLQSLHRWPAADAKLLQLDNARLAELPIDHSVGPALIQGGSVAAQKTLKTFLHSKLGRYNDERNEPDADASSGLSPYLHFGHISTHQIFSDLAAQEEWTPKELGQKATAKKEGWWGMSPDAESFLDELITWRELGYNFCVQTPNYDHYESLPDWAKKTLQEHAGDKRPRLYTIDQLAAGETYDELWNAAQGQLVLEGRIHNYMRMLWGKRVLEWTRTPEEALAYLLELNNRYALDGRNPNSYSGIFWIFGRFDRAWGPEREIYGKIRYMSSENTARKLNVKNYVKRYAPKNWK